MGKMMIGPGFNVKINKSEGSMGTVFAWEVRRFTRTLATGNADTEKEAKAQAWEALQQAAEKSSVTSAQRNAARLKLRDMLEKRTYLVCSVVESLMQGGDRVQCMKNAEAGEKDWHDQTPAGFRIPLPTHHRALSPWEGAGKLWDVFKALGYISADGEQVYTAKLTKWARDNLGGQFLQEDPFEVLEDGKPAKVVEEAPKAVKKAVKKTAKKTPAKKKREPEHDDWED